MNDSDNRRIARNSLLLYLRMGVTMLVKFYIARFLLEVLGIDQYGIWNVVAAYIVTFSFITGPIVTSTQRFLNFDMGRGGANLNKIFSVSLCLIAAFSVVVVIGMETGGLWFLNHKMLFPEGSRYTVNVLYQLAIFSLLVQLMQKPLEATVIAYERMSAYAYISILETGLLLASTLLLKLDLGVDKLISYGVFTLTSNICILSIYKIYCRHKFPCTRFKFCKDKVIFRDLLSFSGWNFFGATATMTAIQGVNVLLNMFFGVVVNAAYGIAQQVWSAVSLVIVTLQKAFDPQIVKSYSANNHDRMKSLVTNVIKIAYLLAFAIIVPLIVNLSLLLHLWIGDNIPDYSYWFCVLILLYMLPVSLGLPVDTAIFATGKIKTYQLWVSSLIFLNVIITYVCFKLGTGPLAAFVVKIAVEIPLLITRFIFLRRVGIGFGVIIRKVLWPVVLLSIISVVPLWLTLTLTGAQEWARLGITFAVFFPVLLLAAWFLLLTPTVRTAILDKLHNRR